MANTPSQPSGLQLMELIEHNIQEILGKEESNVSEIRLYKTGSYWVAFEKSAYLLTSVSPDISLVPMAITRLSAPLVMANIEARRLCTFVKGLDCLQDGCFEKVYRTWNVVDARSYRDWHAAQVSLIARDLYQPSQK